LEQLKRPHSETSPKKPKVSEDGQMERAQSENYFVIEMSMKFDFTLKQL
jgi:hypothetical protein